MSDHSLRNDIAFLKSLAEDGRTGPLLGGPVALTSGLLFGTASLAIWAGAKLGVPGDNLVWAWPVAGTIFGLFMAAYLRRVGPGRGSAQRASAIAWSGAGWAMFTVIASLLLIAYRTQTWQVAAAISPIILALYGCAWFVAGRIYKSLWVSLIAFGSFAMALVNAWFATEGVTGFLVYAVTLYLLVAAPGVLMMRQARRAA
ncbi:hypothetical protein [Phenylobacterium sp.]|jgi:hypothetical protein|uniref:hypothetical protein n=1 Tax=Phenylobacterium sp. TaxID=1871053 RepID=UPI002F9335FA